MGNKLVALFVFVFSAVLVVLVSGCGDEGKWFIGPPWQIIQLDDARPVTDPNEGCPLPESTPNPEATPTPGPEATPTPDPSASPEPTPTPDPYAWFYDDVEGCYWICHRPRGNVDDAHEICVGSTNAVDAHFSHGDYPSYCN